MAERAASRYIRRALGVGKEDVDRELVQIEDVLRSLGPLAILGSQDPVTYVLASGDNSVAHNLGRTPTGRFIVYRSGSATVFDKASATPRDTWVFNASAGVTIKVIWF